MKPKISKQPGTITTAGNKTAILIISSVIGLISSFMVSALNVSLPAISRDFNIDAVMLSWVVTAYVLATAVFSVPFGRLADIVGIKRIFTYGIILFTLTTAVAAFSNSTGMLLACRGIQGIAAAMVAGTSVAMLMATFPANERGKGIGISIACVFIGLSIGPFLGGILTEYLGWRSIFLVVLPLCLFLIAVLFYKVSGEWAECKGEKFDFLG